MKLSHSNKPTKPEAYDLVKLLKEGNQLNEYQIDSLILYFHPGNGKPTKSVESWVSKAVGIRDVRDYINFVQVVNGTIYGADGHRIHQAPTTLPSGAYDPKTMIPVTSDKALPLPPGILDAMTRFFRQSEECRTPCTVRQMREVIRTFNGISLPCLENDHIQVQKKYIMDAVNGDLDAVFYFDPASQYVHGQTMTGKFLIMLMKKKHYMSTSKLNAGSYEQNEQYRRKGESLYKYIPSQLAFVHVYRNDRAKSLKQLIRLYESLPVENDQ